MKALILAGGHATRLWPITRNVAKPLLSLNGRPLVDYIVKELVDHDAVEEVLIATNAKFLDDFKAYRDEYGYDNVRIISEDQDTEEDKPGTIGAILNILEEEGRDDYLIVGGDNYYSFSMDEFIGFARGRNAVASYRVGSKEEAQSFGIMETDGQNRVTAFEEKPEDPRSLLASTACYFFREQDIDVFQKYDRFYATTDIPEDVYLDEPGRLLQWAYERIPVYAFPFDGTWVDVGTRRGYLDAQASFLEGDNRIEGEVHDSQLDGNVWVMDGATVEQSRLEDCIVFPEAHVYDSRLKHSIVDRKASLSGVDLNESLVGEHTALDGG